MKHEHPIRVLDRTLDQQRERETRESRAIRRQLVDYAREEHGASLRQACRAIGFGDSVYQYQPDPIRNDKAVAKLQEAVGRYHAARGEKRTTALIGQQNFMSDSLFGGRRFRTFNLVDDFSRAASSIEVERRTCQLP